MSLSNWQFVARLPFVASLQYIDGSNLGPVSNLLLDSNLLPEPFGHGFIALGCMVESFMKPDTSGYMGMTLYTEQKLCIKPPELICCGMF